MEFVTAAVEVAKKSAEITKKINDIKKIVDVTTSEKDDKFSRVVAKSAAKTLYKNISESSESKEGNSECKSDGDSLNKSNEISTDDMSGNEESSKLTSNTEGIVNDFLDKKEGNTDCKGASDSLNKSNEISTDNMSGDDDSLRLTSNTEGVVDDFLDKKEDVAKVDVEGNQSEAIRISSRNQGLEGDNHEVTGVPFKLKTGENDKGEKVEVVAPEFESEFDAKLPDELCKATDCEQFKECNKQLNEAIENNDEMKAAFTDEQLEQISEGDTPDGYTWHHDIERGKMQLVDSDIHNKTGHTGGKAIWGGGKEKR